MQSTSLITRWLARSELIAAIGLVGLLALSVATIADVVMRTVFNSPIYGFSDLLEIVTPPIVASCLPVALAARQNITIRFLGRALPPRLGQAVELLGQVAVLLFILGVTWRVAVYSWEMFANQQVTWLLGIPTWPFWLLTSLLLVLCLPIQCLVTAETFANMRRGQPLEDEHPELEEGI